MLRSALHRKLARDMWSRRAALAAVVAIVAVGAGVYMGMTALWRDMDRSRARYYKRYRLADFNVELKRAPAWAIEECAQTPNVAIVRGRVKYDVLVDLPHVPQPIAGQVISMPARRRPVLNDILLRSGAWFSDDTAAEAILNDAFARANGLRPGDRIKVRLLDKQHEVLVVGTAVSPEFVYLLAPGGGIAPDPARFGVMYLPERFLQNACDLQGCFNELVGRARDASPAALDYTLHILRGRLDRYGVTRTNTVMQFASVLFLADELNGLKTTATVMPAIFLGVAALVMNVLMSRLVAQQRTVIGTLKALGYSNAAMVRHYLCYGAAVGVAGSLAGAVLGFTLQYLMITYVYSQWFALPDVSVHFYPDVLASGFLISAVFAGGGAVKGVRYAVRLAPAEAMRPPPPERGGKILLERAAGLWRRLPFRAKIMLRAVFRNPFRSTVCILASAVSTGLIVSALSNYDALNYLMWYTFDKVSHEDVNVRLRDPKGWRAAAEARRMPSVASAEPQLAAECDLSNGVSEKRIVVRGLPPGGRLCTPLDRRGAPVRPPEAGLILSKKVSQILHAGPGDVICIRPLIGRRRKVRAPIVGVVDTFLGLSAYADIRYLSRLIGEEYAANTLLFARYPGLGDRGFLRELKRRPAITAIGERERSLRQIQKTFGATMGAMIGLIIAFAGLVAFGSVLNAALVSLSEREREVGVLRVLGYSPRQIAGIFSSESFLLNAAGVAVGLGGGVFMAHALSELYDTELYRFPVILYPSCFILSVIAMLLFAAMAQAIIYAAIRRLPWLDVMKIKE